MGFPRQTFTEVAIFFDVFLLPICKIFRYKRSFNIPCSGNRGKELREFCLSHTPPKSNLIVVMKAEKFSLF